MSGALEPIGASAKALGVLKDLPLWLLTAVATWLLIFPLLPDARDMLSTSAIGWVRAAGILFALLAVCRFVSVLIPIVRANREKRRTLHLTLEDNQSFWHIAKQRDGSMATQFTLRFMAKNLTNSPLHLLKARIIRPKIRGELIQDIILVRSVQQNVYSTAQTSGNYIPPNALLPISVTIMSHGSPKQTTGRMRTLIGITDASGNETRIKLSLKSAP
jgi:hypothetical protein